MNKWKIYAILMTLVCIGSLKELFRILTSDASDIVNNRFSVLPIAFILTSVVVYFAVRFWRKAYNLPK